MWRSESEGKVDRKGRTWGRIGRWMGFGPASHAFEDIQIIVDLECEVIPAFGAVCGAETEFVVTSYCYRAFFVAIGLELFVM